MLMPSECRKTSMLVIATSEDCSLASFLELGLHIVSLLLSVLVADFGSLSIVAPNVVGS